MKISGKRLSSEFLSNLKILANEKIRGCFGNVLGAMVHVMNPKLKVDLKNKKVQKAFAGFLQVLV